MVSRVTNSMISRTLLSNLSMNLGNLDKLQNQLASGRSYAHISDNPSALIYGQAARNKLARLGHYQQTVSTAQTWLTQAESGVMELQKVVGNVYEELVNAGGPKTDEDKKNVAMLVNQLREHYLDTLNSSYGDRFVFSGYNTPGDYVDGNAVTKKPFTIEDGNLLYNGFNITQFDGLPAEYLYTDLSGFSSLSAADQLKKLDALGGYASVAAFNSDPDNASFGDLGATPPVEPFDNLLKFHSLMSDVINFDVGPGITMPVTMNGLDVLFFTTQADDGTPIMRNMFELLNEVHTAVNGDEATNTDPLPTDELTKLIKLVQEGQNHLLVKTAEIGGRDRRLELLDARYSSDEINYNQMRSDAEDADIAEVITAMKLAQTVYQASLSAGANVIQPSLMDFLR